ncbi:hypothetical protein MLD38_028307 [Melastoma candidum]|uniref:Uncharacterized protein n=1 Tax=Melastoma candidum TaxID=119954 RepID=A0ACB9N6M3_9MYRT|nr:hypothetical protein MLD38_028307 [Melastoma candidum]
MVGGGRKGEGEEREDYRFLKLNDAMACIGQKVNLVGVLLEFGFPHTTKGTDFNCSLRIIDESCSQLGVSVNCFAGKPEQLPIVASPGDIIQLSRVEIKRLDGKVYALFNKKFSSFALYDGNTTDYTPYQVSARFHKRESDKRSIMDLQKWFAKFEVVPDEKERHYIKDIKLGLRLNMTCMILHKQEVSKNEWIIYLWDGTDTPDNSMQSRLADEMDNPIPLQLEAEPLSRDLLCSFPSVGSILRVVLDKGMKHLGLGLLKAGEWEFVSRCLRDYDDRFSTKYGHVPGSSLTLPSPIAEIDDVDVPFVTLMEVLCSSEAIAKFKCMVRVVATVPYEAKDFLSPKGIYRIRLTLEDPTARVHAFVYDEDGATFFQGYPSHDILQRSMNQLLGLDENYDGNGTEYTERNPPVIQCCLKTYYLNKDDIWGTRCFRVFGTRLVC